MTMSSSLRARTPRLDGSGGRAARRRAAATAVAVLAAVGLVATPAQASHYQASLEGSTFQIDTNANFVVDADTITGGADTGPVANKDWNNVDESRQNDLATGTNDNSYQGGVKEDTSCPATTTGSIPNNKSDLKTFGIYTEPGSSPTDPGYLHMFWTRVSDPSGTTLMDFEFNQSGTACTTGVNKQRTTDDLLIEYSIVQGGARAVITVRKWTGTAWGPVTTFSAAQATGTTNTSLITSANTGTVSDVDLQARTFGEASIDLDAIFDPAKCTSFGSAMLKSRSSDSFTSQLKDFIAPLPINLSNCAQVTITKQTDPDGATQKFGFSKTFTTDPATDWPALVELADGESKTSSKVLLGNNLTVSENDLPAGWTFDSLDCSASIGVFPTINNALRKATFNLDSTSDHVKCTFNNSRLRGSIQVEKVVTGTTTRIDGASFAIDEDGQANTTTDRTPIPEVAGQDGLFCIDDLLFGTYNVLETAPPAGYSSAGAAQAVIVDSASTCADRTVGDVDATFTNRALPQIVTQASGPVTVGEKITDTATLSGGFNPTGTITFKAYSDAACSNEVFSDEVDVDAGNGNYTSGEYTTLAQGTIYWIASYSGDTSNAPDSGACGDANESSAVGKIQPQIETQASGPVTVGETITDTATLSGGFNPTGTITFTAYSDAGCATQVFTDDVDVDSGNGNYTSAAYTTTAAGTIYWIASYSGDANNEGDSGACGDANESSVVAKDKPAITTDAQDEVVVGGTITDTATLSGGFNPTGLITFKAYSDDECKTEVFSDTAIVNGNGSYTSDPYTTTGAGTIYWIGSYGGDANNDPVSGTCGDPNESSLVKPASPGIATTPKLLPNDSALLSGGFGTLTGTISFALFASADCTGDAIYEEGPLTVNGYGPYETSNDEVFIMGDGTYSWEVTYSGDGNNNGAFSSCTAEQQVVDFTPLAAPAGLLTGP